MHERPGIQRVYREMIRDHRDLSFERERARTMGVLLSAKGQRRDLERQYSEDKGRTRRSKTKVKNPPAEATPEKPPDAVSPKMASAMKAYKSKSPRPKRLVAAGETEVKRKAVKNGRTGGSISKGESAF